MQRICYDTLYMYVHLYLILIYDQFYSIHIGQLHHMLKTVWLKLKQVKKKLVCLSCFVHLNVLFVSDKFLFLNLFNCCLQCICLTYQIFVYSVYILSLPLVADMCLISSTILVPCPALKLSLVCPSGC